MTIDKFIGLRSREARSAFTLVELLTVLTIMAILLSVSFATINAISGGETMGQISTMIASTLVRARTTAMAHNTYVWVGFSSNSSGLIIAAVESTTGQATDLSTASALNPIMKPLLVPNVNLSAISSLNSSSVTSMTNNGMDTASSDYIEVTNSTIGTFSVSVSGASTPFTQIIQFNSQGETLANPGNLWKWVNLALVPLHGKSTNIADIQVAGTTGDVLLFQP